MPVKADDSGTASGTIAAPLLSKVPVANSLPKTRSICTVPNGGSATWAGNRLSQRPCRPKGAPPTIVAVAVRPGSSGPIASAIALAAGAGASSSPSQSALAPARPME